MLEPLTSKGVWAVLRGRRVSDGSLLPDPTQMLSARFGDMMIDTPGNVEIRGDDKLVVSPGSGIYEVEVMDGQQSAGKAHGQWSDVVILYTKP